MPFEVIPAIDIKGGKCVRLFKGNYEQETVYSLDPVEVALRWQKHGAKRIHIIDLDGAASGNLQNLPVIQRILREGVSIPIQFGGGIRSLSTIGMLLEMGIENVILGTKAVEDIELVKQSVSKFTNQVLVSIDTRNGFVATGGWLSDSKITGVDLAKRTLGLGINSIIYTDISRDGTLTEPNFDAIQEMVTLNQGRIIASGGVSTIEHLLRLKNLGCGGSIIGKALYEGSIEAGQAFAV